MKPDPHEDESHLFSFAFASSITKDESPTVPHRNLSRFVDEVSSLVLTATGLSRQGDDLGS